MSYKPDNVPQLSAYLVVRDAKASLDFYKTAFGFQLVHSVDGEYGSPQHVNMKKEEANIMFCPEGAFGTDKKSPISQKIKLPINLYIYCNDVDLLYENAISKGAISVLKPQNSFWGDKFCTVLDLDHYEWSFATHLKQK